MPQQRVLWQLYSFYLLIITLSLVALSWFATRTIKSNFLERTSLDLRTHAGLIEKQALSLLNTKSHFLLDSLTVQYSHTLHAEVDIVWGQGAVANGSPIRSEAQKQLLSRDEVLSALAGTPTSNTGFNKSTAQVVMYVAEPIELGGRVVGAVWIAQPIGFLDDPLQRVGINIALGALFVGLLAAAAGWWIVRRFSRPLEELKIGAQRFARGDLGGKVAVIGSEEFAGVAEGMNEMARQLDDRIHTVTRQRNEQDAILASMIEGVLAVDADERLMNYNVAAQRLLGISADQARGRLIHEVIRNAELQRLITRTLASQSPVEADLLLTENGDQHLQALGTRLKDARGASIGALVVMHDVTRLRKLESMRRDFVANVSHELKTPITSIKGFVETLQDGAVNDLTDAERFLGIIARQVNRLNSIVDDLLSLSRIEQEAENEEFYLEEGDVCDILRAGVNACGPKATEKNIKITLRCNNGLHTLVNPALLEQAVINLIDNAIKYSDNEKPVRVAAELVDRNICISVTDEGRGIAKEHLPRLWERFYRVDKARSRAMGGTGLGLAIVKHIVLAHGGRVAVESTPGEGSNFMLYIPLRATRTGDSRPA